MCNFVNEMTTSTSLLLTRAKELLAQEQVIAIPTETVYGLAGNMWSEKAVNTIYNLKQRPRSNPLIVHVASLDAAQALVKEIPDPLLELAKQFWPGPLTLLLEKSSQVPDTITAGSSKVALRIPAHPLTRTLLEQLSFPLVAPSANPYTRISPTTAEHVRFYFGDTIPLILDGGPCEKGLESTIIGLDNNQPVLYRAGALALEQIEQCIGPITHFQPQGNETPSPGLAARHYAPLTPTEICKREEIESKYSLNAAVLVLQHAIAGIPLDHQFVLAATGSLPEAAQNFYRVLHQIDQTGFKKIICEQLPTEGLGITLNDKLTRASSPANLAMKS
jgi:L-threonylcarbamoyladenylate synthase